MVLVLTAAELLNLMVSPFSILRQRHRLGRRLLVQILVVSTFLAILGTGYQLYSDFQKDVGTLETRVAQIESSYLKGIENSLWTYDTEQVDTQLQGILRLPDIRHLELTAVSGDRYVAGAPYTGRKAWRREFQLHHGAEKLGTLRVTTSLEGPYQRLWSRTLLILITQTVKTLFVSIFILLIVHRLVTQHLGTMSEYTSGLNLEHLDKPLQLNRPKSKAGVHDELDEVVRSINEMRLSLKAELLDRIKAEEEIRSLNLELEGRVALRTSELERSNEHLQIARKSAEEANRAKSRFIASMSHELRTPLSAILLYCELLESDERVAGDEVLLKDLGNIRNAGKHLQNLINNILDISKIEAGKMTLDLRFEHIPDLMKDLAATIMPLVDKNQNKLVLEVDPGIGVMETDGTKVRQVLMNLLGNACKFTKHGTITLGAEPDKADPGGVRFWVRDTGIGLTEGQIANLFGEYQQAETSTYERYGGSGLGLAICQGFSQLLGGEILVESTYGVGSCFTLRLPAPVSGHDTE